jgi:predicted DCC family thiol-disulfide oxidoreductase YuxK
MKFSVFTENKKGNMATVKLNKTVKTIEVFYDARCGMCRTFIDWLAKQERACELVTLDYQSDEAKREFPEIINYDPEKEIVVRMDVKDVYQGAEGWVCCLWSCSKYRDVAAKMNSRLLLPMAKKICYYVSKNRLGVSKIFFRKKTEEIAREVEKDKQIKCEGGCGE